MDVLTKERVETKKRVAALKEQTKLERLQKEEIDNERELVVLRRSSLLELITGLFKKGGKTNGSNRTQETHS